MQKQRFLIATEGTFHGRQISSECIDSILGNFISGGATIPVVYDFYDWSPALSEVLALYVDSDGGKKRLYVEVRATEELQDMAARDVDYFLAPAILCIDGIDSHSRLTAVGITKDPVIPGMDKMQFSKANHTRQAFFPPNHKADNCSEKITVSEKNVHRVSYYQHGAHAGNVYLRVEGWGMNCQAVEDEVIRLVGQFIKGLNFKRNFSSGPVVISCAHPLTAEQIAEWVQLKQ